jgi:DNA-directed RNA polymerase specialized sigma24 family protein
VGQVTRRELLAIAKAELTDNQYRAFDLRVLGHTYAEIGLELDISRQAARDRVRSAEQRLRRHIAHRKVA